MEDQKNNGEKLEGKGVVKTDGFEKSIAFLMLASNRIWEMVQKHKSFRMELEYNAETLNTEYSFFVSDDDKCSSDDAHEVMHTSVFSDGSGTEVEIKMKTERLTEEDMLRALGFMAQSSHRFYLEMAEKIKSRL